MRRHFPNYLLNGRALDRFCSQILPKIHHKIKWLNLESSIMNDILLCTNYPKTLRPNKDESKIRILSKRDYLSKQRQRSWRFFHVLHPSRIFILLKYIFVLYDERLSMQ
jgi:hypothetical protein